MLLTDQPLVSIVTPVYNGEAYLSECIESVMAQTYVNWDYTIVNNCSTDRTLEIAERYAMADKRIRVHNNEKFLDIISNHNGAFRLISADSKYCKVVSADDWIFPECVMRMVELAEANPSVGIVGSYQLSGGGNRWCVRTDELPFPSTVVLGREICRLHLLSEVYVFGNPTSSLYRSDLIKMADSFFPNSTAEADASTCFKYLRYVDFGFVHQVLSYERVHQGAMSAKCRNIDTYASSKISDLIEYGPFYLTKDELERRLDELLYDYYKLLAVAVVNFRDKEFWNYHKRRLEELGHPLSGSRLAKATFMKLLDLVFNPKQTIEKTLSHLKRN